MNFNSRREKNATGYYFFDGDGDKTVGMANQVLLLEVELTKLAATFACR